jgi:hypothetical protein
VLFQQPNREFRHGDVGLLLDLLDQERLKGRQLAGATRAALAHGSE